MAELVKITIDGVQIQVPKGTNLIEAALKAGVEIPYYCYHPHLSIAGNCRMCQVQLEGAPKLTIACNTGATEGMVVRTHRTAPEVADAQRATLEFLLINHPLDCTVCDQAGHCKLQDYYYTYNAKPSRFIEDKVHKVKAEPLGPEVVYDGERCILCTRCVRFCEEVPKTGELGLYNRGDHAVIGVNPGHELTNPLSGTVVDLCPVGALTHERWRFNTRIWYTNSADTVCAGCSTGCNAKAYERDGRIVQVKGRLNAAVNKEWMCDEGRYGFERFQPATRLETPLLRSKGTLQPANLDDACKAAGKLSSSMENDTSAAVFLSPSLTLEEVWVALEFAKRVMQLSPGTGQIAMQLRMRALSDIEKILISPDYSGNARAASLFGLGSSGNDWRESLEAGYDRLIQQVRRGSIGKILIVGDGAILARDADEALRKALSNADAGVMITARGPHRVESNGKGQEEVNGITGASLECAVLLPGRTVNEKNGVFVNRDGRFQRIHQLLTPPFNSRPEWIFLNRIAKALGKSILPDTVTDERSLFREMVRQFPALAGLSLAQIGSGGVSLAELQADAKKNREAGVGVAA